MSSQSTVLYGRCAPAPVVRMKDVGRLINLLKAGLVYSDAINTVGARGELAHLRARIEHPGASSFLDRVPVSVHLVNVIKLHVGFVDVPFVDVTPDELELRVEDVDRAVRQYE